MATAVYRPRFRHFGLLGLVLLALVLVSAVGVAIFSDEQLYDPEELFESPVLVNPEKQPTFVFPEELRSTDLSLNLFVDRFFRLCAHGKYSEIRLMISQRAGDALPPSRFERMFNAMKEARINSIRRLPDVPGAEGPAYLLTAEYDLEAHAMKTQKIGNRVRLLIRKEEGEWRLGPVSRDLIEKLEAYDAANAGTQPVETSPTSAPAHAPTSTKVIANQPIRLDPEE